jgi:hypothetical protein
MSTSPESIRVGDRIVTAISRWLNRRSTDEELRAELEAVDLSPLTPSQAEAVLELENELEVRERPAVEAIARETLEDVAVAE